MGLSSPSHHPPHFSGWDEEKMVWTAEQALAGRFIFNIIHVVRFFLTIKLSSNRCFKHHYMEVPQEVPKRKYVSSLWDIYRLLFPRNNHIWVRLPQSASWLLLLERVQTCSNHQPVHSQRFQKGSFLGGFPSFLATYIKDIRPKDLRFARGSTRHGGEVQTAKGTRVRLEKNICWPVQRIRMSLFSSNLLAKPKP